MKIHPLFFILGIIIFAQFFFLGASYGNPIVESLIIKNCSDIPGLSLDALDCRTNIFYAYMGFTILIGLFSFIVGGITMTYYRRKYGAPTTSLPIKILLLIVRIPIVVAVVLLVFQPMVRLLEGIFYFILPATLLTIGHFWIKNYHNTRRSNVIFWVLVALFIVFMFAITEYGFLI
jgi:hypothetical protein